MLVAGLDIGSVPGASCIHQALPLVVALHEVAGGSAYDLVPQETPD